MKRNIIRLTEGDLRNIVKNTVKRVLKENYGITDGDDDMDGFHEFTPNRSKFHRDETEDNFMGGVDPSDDEFDEYGNYEGNDMIDSGTGDLEEPWSPDDIYDDEPQDRYNNALQRQKFADKVGRNIRMRDNGKPYPDDYYMNNGRMRQTGEDDYNRVYGKDTPGEDAWRDYLK